MPALNCDIPRPTLRGSKGKPCRICGYVIGKQLVRDRKKGIKHIATFTCCSLEAHHKCWLGAKVDGATLIICSNLRCLLEKSGAEKFVKFDDPNKEVVRKYAVCEYCGKEIEIATAGSTHLRDECEVLAELRAEDDGIIYTDSDLMERKRIKRLAETGLVLARAATDAQKEKRDATIGSAGSRNASSQRRTVSAESQVT